jgi:hypothetical protein
MSGDDIEEVVHAVRAALEANGTLTGTRVAQAVRDAVPGFDARAHGFGSFREFVIARVPGVSVIARSGMDVVYGFGTASSSTQTPTEPPADLWRVWTSPNSPRVLAVKTADGTVRAVPRGTAGREGEVLLATPSTSVHQSIAKQFLAECAEPIRLRLAPIIEAAAPRWWEAWLVTLRGQPELTQWYERRKTALVDELRGSLEKAGVTGDAASTAVTDVVRSHHAARPRDEPRRPPLRSGEPRSGTTAFAMRELVLRAVQGLGENELRELRLPLGAVIDALRELGVVR